MVLLNGRQALAGTLILVFGFVVGYFVGQSAHVLRSSTKAPSEDAPAGETLGPWKASFRIPGSLQVPQDQPAIRCDFSRPVFGLVNETITNLVDKSFVISYQVYGYDPKGRRVSEAEDEFAIGAGIDSRNGQGKVLHLRASSGQERRCPHQLQDSAS